MNRATHFMSALLKKYPMIMYSYCVFVFVFQCKNGVLHTVYHWSVKS